MSQPQARAVETERRFSERISVHAKATLLLGHLGSAIPCTLTDVSPNGCRLRTDMDTRTGRDAPVEVSFRLGSSSFRLAGCTEWSANSREFGVSFTEVNSSWESELVEALGEHASQWQAKQSEWELANRGLQAACEKLERLTGEYESKRSREAEARAEVEQAVRETREANERLTGAKRDLLTAQKAAERAAAMLAAGTKSVIERVVRPGMNGPLKEAVRAVPAAEVAKSAEQGNPAPAPVKQGRERRQLQRHDVDSTATVLLVDIGSNLRGRIVDVSLSGCRIRFADKFPVGIYRRVEVEFMLDGLPFRLPGVVQSLHDRCTAGIRFIDLSQRKREHLMFVIEEMEEMSGEKEAQAE